MQVTKGQRFKVGDAVPNGQHFVTGLSIASPGLTIDFSCFGVDAGGKLSDERYMTFFNQPRTPCGAVAMEGASAGAASFTFSLDKLPASIDRLVITAAIDGNGTISQIGKGHLRLLDSGREAARFDFSGSDFAAEKAVILGEFYRKDGIWRFSATAQGFNGGLDALVRHFGGNVSKGAAPAASSSTTTAPAAGPAPALSPPHAARLALDKRIEREAPKLVSLVKKASVSLDKAGLGAHRAKVALCLDISGSMSGLYKSGQVQAFAERVLALACRFDDDGEIDVFLFGGKAHNAPAMNLGNYQTHIRDLTVKYPLEGDTRYALAMRMIRDYYFGASTKAKSLAASMLGLIAGRKDNAGAATEALPVYVMFVTDGDAGDRSAAEQELREASKLPIFWQFMGIGSGGFAFLEELDDLSGRVIDNANFFRVSHPGEHSDDRLFDLLMTEYPGWVKLAKSRSMIS